VSNTGNAALSGVSVADTVSALITGAVQSTPAGIVALASASVGGGTWFGWSGTGLTFASGTALTFTITGQLGPVCVPTTVTNAAFAQATNTCAALLATSNVTSFTVGAPAPSITAVKQQVTTGGIGAAILYRVIVTNNGTATVTTV